MDYDINFVANLLQFADFYLNISQSSNDQIMKEIQKQNTEYLEKIIKNQEKIIKLLENNDGIPKRLRE